MDMYQKYEHRKPWFVKVHVQYIRMIWLNLGTLIGSSNVALLSEKYTDKKEKKIFLIYTEIQMGAVAKSYMRKGFLIYE